MSKLNKSIAAVAMAVFLGVLSPLVPFSDADPAFGSESISYDFNSTGDLAADFNGYVAAGTVTQSTSGGIGDSGAIEVNPSVTTNAVYATKDGYSLGPVGSTYTFSSQMRSFANNGYSGMGFSSLIPSSGNAGGTPFHPNDAIGVSVHGGGYVFHNGTTNASGNWASTYNGSNDLFTISTGSGITTGCNDSDQDNCWYKVLFKITRDSSSTFDARVELYGSSQSGALDSETAIAIVEFRDQTNSTLTSADLLYSYINFSGQRMKYFDNFQVDLAGGASVISAGAPVVLTSSASESSAVVTVSGNVTSDGGAAVTERGFVYGTSANPTISGNKVTSGTGTGTFSGVTPALSPGTYYFRAYATNSTGTSYGSETTAVVKGSQVFSWSPSTSLTLADSGLALNATLTTGDGTVSYSVVDAGTTGCSVSGSTLTFSSTGTGANGCEVRPVAAVSSNFNAKTDASTVTFDVTQGTFAVSAPSSKVGTSRSSFTNVCTSSCDVSGFAAADEVLVVINESDGSALSGEVKLGSTTGLTQSLTGYQSDATQSGLYELAFEGTPSEVNAALETLQYKSPSGGGDETIQISASLSGAAYSTDTGHYYEVVNVGSAVAWEDARCRAKYGDSSAHDNSAGLTQTDDECTNTGSRRTFNGLNGYLANITSLEEHNFLRTKLNDLGWIGGADLDTEGTFQWVDGPEAGQTFFIAGTSTIRTTNTIDGVSQFNYFSDGEPNNSGGAEDFVEFGFGNSGVGSSWNDCQNSCGSRIRFVVEYGGDGGTVLKQASNTFDVGAPTAPLQVTGAAATGGDAQVSLSWSAPGTGGSAITDYVIEQLDSDGSTWNTLTDGVSTSTSFTVTGLTNGTSYSFRVSAKNTIGTGTVSSTVSATPAVPAPSGGGGSGGGSSPAPVVTPTPALPRILTPPQPTPRPTVLRGPVVSPGRGFDPTVGTRATVGGALATAVKTAVPGGVSVRAGAFAFGVRMVEETTTTADPTNDLTVKSGSAALVEGSGMLPGSPVQVWLPGRNGTETRELTRAVVGDDGVMETELSFTARPSEAPIAIGPQVLQVTGYDEDGNLTVVDMPVNIAQGPVVPEPNKQVGALPELSVGSSLATSAGLPTPVTMIPLPEEKRVSVGDGSWSLLVDVDPDTSVVGGTPEAPVVQVTQDSVGSASGEGFMPGTTASVWMFSDPTLLGTVTVGEDGSFTAEFQVDSTYLPVGTHTLQVQGVGDDGYIKAANLGVDVQAPVDLTTTGAAGLLWWVIGATLALLVVLLLIFALRRRSSRSAN